MAVASGEFPGWVAYASGTMTLSVTIRDTEIRLATVVKVEAEAGDLWELRLPSRSPLTQFDIDLWSTPCLRPNATCVMPPARYSATIAATSASVFVARGLRSPSSNVPSRRLSSPRFFSNSPHSRLLSRLSGVPSSYLSLPWHACWPSGTRADEGLED